MSTLEPGSALGGYRIIARLRAGAMGVLYLARRDGAAEFSRPVAIKVIHDHLAQNSRFCRMFIDEAKLSARIDHPNVVRVEEFGKADGRFYLVMEYVHGVSLAQVIGVLQAAGRMPIEHAVAIAIAVAGGLHGAHEATDDDGAPLAIVHRDVSPHNVLVSYTGAVRVIDFGIAKARQVGGQTRTGSLRGKLAYMPPEQARSARTVDRRADLYGLGLVLWEMLTFRRVFDADTDIAILNQIKNPMIVPPSALAPDVPRALDDIVMRTLAKDPGGRPQSGLHLQRALGDAYPKALSVLSTDLAALMAKVRARATALAEGNEDPAGLYGGEIRRTLTIVGKQMHDETASGRPSHAVIDSEGRGLASVIVNQGESDAMDAAQTQRLSAPPVAHPSPSLPMRSQQPTFVALYERNLTADPSLRPVSMSAELRIFIAVAVAITLLGIGIAIGNGALGTRAEPGSTPTPGRSTSHP